MTARSCVTCTAPLSGRGRRLYCSSDCAVVTMPCETCGETFPVQPKRVHRSRFCSPACYARPTSYPDRVTVECQWCGVAFTKAPSQIAIGRGRFCSRTCAGLGRPINCRPSQIAAAAAVLVRTSLTEHSIPEMRVGRWSIDLAYPAKKIAVEFDGEYWHSLPTMVDRDRRKDAWLTARGWTVVRVVMRKSDTSHDVAQRALEAIAQ